MNSRKSSHLLDLISIRTLTQLAKTRRAVFVEGKDFQILSKLARVLNRSRVSSRGSFAVIPVEGFNPDRIRNLRTGIETTLGGRIKAAAVFDRDYRSDEECASILKGCEPYCDYAVILSCKEIENLLLVPSSINRAAARRVNDKAKRTGKTQAFELDSEKLLSEYADQRKSYVQAQYVACRRLFIKQSSPALSEASIAEKAIIEFESAWEDQLARFAIIPGKEAISHLNGKLQGTYGVSLTPSAIADAMRIQELPLMAKVLIEGLDKFAAS